MKKQSVPARKPAAAPNAVMVTFGKRHASTKEKFNMLREQSDESASGFAIELIKESIDRRIKRIK